MVLFRGTKGSYLGVQRVLIQGYRVFLLRGYKIFLFISTEGIIRGYRGFLFSGYRGYLFRGYIGLLFARYRRGYYFRNYNSGVDKTFYAQGKIWENQVSTGLGGAGNSGRLFIEVGVG
jgi:hypothetical protein